MRTSVKERIVDSLRRLAGPHSFLRTHLGTWRGMGVVAVVAIVGFILVPPSAMTMPESVRIPIVEPHGTGEPPDAALFSHWTHSQYQCYECHPSIFPQRKLGFTHADMRQGKFCAACHDGNLAWHFEDDSSISCETCHVEREPDDLDDIDFDDLFGMVEQVRFAKADEDKFWNIPLAVRQQDKERSYP